MATRRLLLTLLACWSLKASRGLNIKPNTDMEFTFVLPAGSRECFYQTTDKNSSLEFQYQVVGSPNLDVGFVMVSPSGRREAYDYRRSHAIHSVALTEAGDYKLCFDNSYSRRKEKLLFFAIVITTSSNDTDDYEDLETDIITLDDMELKLDDIRTQLEKVYRSIQRGRLIQLMLKTFDTRDVHLQEDNLWKVTFWSFISMVCVLTVAGVQVYTLQSFFSNTRPG
ncbi:transmembrane emp24 domain-containing protein 1-like [Nerophis ophidion]|uniref:transmembrane emp24 domain-containing protein 1-like n=1 Tax=Nerophis ophidion TaxID=159077 RepID=UPI002ADF3C47|nr:transmembrane emp24 domain-containing protein 1-like [Nerophis ophidion]XP_061761171.1 transmembrane emp24 domain-containing protein 1-like [Nerophis ophidion]